MSPDELVERVAVVEEQVRTLTKHVVPMAKEFPRALELLESTNRQAFRTNGRVTRLERKERDAEVREDERRKLAAKKAADAARREARRAERRGWLPPATVAVFCTVLGALLNHFISVI